VTWVTYIAATARYSGAITYNLQGSAAMKTNVGGIDKILRVVVGLALIAMAALGVVGAWGWIGVVPLLTGLFGVCPAYSLLGMNTCPIRKNS
jgi:hypothetical protein